MQTNVLYYGDNLDILRHEPSYIPPESVDLVYLDPPFNSNAAYSVIFKDESGRGSDAQITAFDDTWHWGPDAERQYLFLTNNVYHQGRVPSTVSALIGAFHAGIKPSPMLAYLVEMAVRLVELHRVLKPTGSLYLHCDPTASHYLKLLLDAIFGPELFFSEIVWKRWSAHGDAKRYGAVHDVLLLYGKTAEAKFHKQYAPYDDEYVQARFKFIDADGRRWAEQNLVSPNPRPNLTYAYTASNGVTYQPHRNGWKVTKERMEQLDKDGRLHFPPKGERLRLKTYLDEQLGAAVQDVWTDIYGVGGSASERLGYPTQKPMALLERIISSATDQGDVVLDPFCGCGTATVAAQKLGRRWIGIDITYLAIAVMRQRLRDSFPELGEIEVVNRPTEVAGARAMLADSSLEHRYQFQWWALDLVGATPQGSIQKKGADKGVDGLITFTGAGGRLETCIVSVKSGGVGSAMIDELKGAMEGHGAAMGLFLTLEEPTAPMKAAAAQAGYYHSELSGKDYPRVQILTVHELLDEGRKPQLPLLILPTYQRAERVQAKAAEQRELFGS